MKIRLAHAIGIACVGIVPLAFAHSPVVEPLAVVTSSTSIQALPAHDPSAPKTRAQVKAELIEAQRAGLHPITEADYPPSERAIRRNKARFAEMERHQKAKQAKRELRTQAASPAGIVQPRP